MRASKSGYHPADVAHHEHQSRISRRSRLSSFSVLLSFYDDLGASRAMPGVLLMERISPITQSAFSHYSLPLLHKKDMHARAAFLAEKGLYERDVSIDISYRTVKRNVPTRR